MSAKIDEKMKADKSVSMPLRGLVLGSGLFSPKDQLDIGANLFQTGLVDSKQRIHFEGLKRDFDKYLNGTNYLQALEVILSSAFSRKLEHLFENGSLQIMRKTRNDFEDLSGVDSLNYLVEEDVHYGDYKKYLTQPEIRQAIHAGSSTTFINQNSNYTDEFLIESLKSSKEKLENLLQEEYQVLLYHRQTDVLTPYPSTERSIEKLFWKYSNLYK